MLDWVEQLLSTSRYTFATSRVESESKRSPVAVQTALRRLKEQGRIVSPRRGFYVVLPPEYRVTRSPPASWLIDDLMRHLGQPYYVGLLSAAAVHGPAHQQPLVFQVVPDRPTREMHAGKVATVLVELVERIDGQALVKITHLVKLPNVQRLGYLLDAVGER